MVAGIVLEEERKLESSRLGGGKWEKRGEKKKTKKREGRKEKGKKKEERL